jgi:hypothetical protein
MPMVLLAVLAFCYFLEVVGPLLLEAIFLKHLVHCNKL